MAPIDLQPTEAESERRPQATAQKPSQPSLVRTKHRQLTALAANVASRRLPAWFGSSSWLRSREIATAHKPDPVLSEIVGVRLLLVNLLQPRDQHDPLTKESFETLLGEIKRVKKQVAIEIERENGRR